MVMIARWTAGALLILTLVMGCSDSSAPPDGLGTIEIVIEPAGFDAPWRIVGPGGFQAAHQGDHTLVDTQAGRYSLTWGHVQQ